MKEGQPVCALCIIVLFWNSLGVGERAPSRWTGEGLCVCGGVFSLSITPLWYWPMKETMDSTGTLEEKNMGDLGERLVSWNFISHYISNLIMWRNVTPVKSLGVDTELKPVETHGELTAWSLHVSATVGGFGEPQCSTTVVLPASAVNWDPPS